MHIVEDELPVVVARSVLGRHFFGADEWRPTYGIRLGQHTHKHGLTTFPWGLDVLHARCPFTPGRKVCETHFAFLGLPRFRGHPFTIARYREVWLNHDQPRFQPNRRNFSWEREPFSARATCSLRWYLMPLNVWTVSRGKTYEEQVAMMPVEYEVPLAVEEVTKLILYFMRTRSYLDPEAFARCRELTSDGDRVLVGGFDQTGIAVSSWTDDYQAWSMGLALSRKV